MTPPATPLLNVNSITKCYASVNGPLQALDGVSLTLSEGEFVSIVGPSGCGKTTLIKIIGDIIEPTSGSVTVNDSTAREARLKGLFSYVFQSPALLPWRRVIDNVRLPLEVLHKQSRDPRELLRLVGLEGFEDRYPHELSGGMQQRVALARALTYDPDILIMDEPFGALDELTRGSLNLELLNITQKHKMTVLFITHNISEAVFLADRVVILSSRPARVKHVQEIGFTRPRDVSIRDLPEFQEVVRCLRNMLE